MSSIVSYKGKGWSLLEDTNNHILKPPLIDRGVSSTCYPSNASAWVKDGSVLYLEGGCNRASYYRMTGEPATNPPGAYSTYINEHGKYIEEFLISKWKEMGIWVNNNVKFFSDKYGFPISGEVDAFVTKTPGSKDTKDIIICEIKSYYKWFKKSQLQGTKDSPGKPAYNNLFQVMLYLDHYKTIGINKAKIMYTARDEAKQFEFDLCLKSVDGKTYPCIDGVVDNSVAVEDIIDRYKELWSYYQKKEMPPKDFRLIYEAADIEEKFNSGQLSKTKYEDFKKGKSVGDWQCSWCSYMDLCWDIQHQPNDPFLID